MSYSPLRVCYVTHESDTHGMEAIRCLRGMERAHVAVLTGSQSLKDTELASLFQDQLPATVTQATFVALQTSPGRYPSSHSRIVTQKDFETRGFMRAPWNRDEDVVHLMFRVSSMKVPDDCIKSWHYHLAGIKPPGQSRAIRKLRKSGRKARMSTYFDVGATTQIPQPYATSAP